MYGLLNILKILCTLNKDENISPEISTDSILYSLCNITNDAQSSTYLNKSILLEDAHSDTLCKTQNNYDITSDKNTFHLLNREDNSSSLVLSFEEEEKKSNGLQNRERNRDVIFTDANQKDNPFLESTTNLESEKNCTRGSSDRSFYDIELLEDVQPLFPCEVKLQAQKSSTYSQENSAKTYHVLEHRSEPEMAKDLNFSKGFNNLNYFEDKLFAKLTSVDCHTSYMDLCSNLPQSKDEVMEESLNICTSSEISTLKTMDQKLSNFMQNFDLFSLNGEHPFVMLVYKILERLDILLGLNKIEKIYKVREIMVSYYENKVMRSLHERNLKDQFAIDFIEDKIFVFYKIITSFDILKSLQHQYERKTFFGLHFRNLFFDFSDECFKSVLKRSNGLIRHRNIYLYVLDELNNILNTIPEKIRLSTCFLLEIMNEVDKINFKSSEFPELSSIYSLLKFNPVENKNMMVVYFFTKVMNLMLDNDSLEKKERLHICYNFIFLMLEEFSSKIRNLVSHEEMKNTCVNMCIIANDIIWKDIRRKLYFKVLDSPITLYNALVTRTNLLNHVFLSLEIIFVNKILDDYNIQDVQVRRDCRKIVKNKIQDFLMKSEEINKLSLINVSLALHSYIVKKDFHPLEELLK